VAYLSATARRLGAAALFSGILIAEPAPTWTLEVSSASVSSSGGVTATLLLRTPKGSEPVALQWELSYPSPQMASADKDWKLSANAQSAGKSLSCRGHAKDAGTYVYRCILAGGFSRLPEGAVAEIQFLPRAGAQPANATLHLSGVVGVAADGHTIPGKSADSNIPIR